MDNRWLIRVSLIADTFVSDDVLWEFHASDFLIIPSAGDGIGLGCNKDGSPTTSKYPYEADVFDVTERVVFPNTLTVSLYVTSKNKGRAFLLIEAWAQLQQQ